MDKQRIDEFMDIIQEAYTNLTTCPSCGGKSVIYKYNSRLKDFAWGDCVLCRGIGTVKNQSADDMLAAINEMLGELLDGGK